MTDSSKPQVRTGEPPAVADVQDPLPESNWLFRRIYFYAVTAVILVMVWLQLDRLGDVAILQPVIGIPAFITIIQWLLACLFVTITYYSVAPSAEQIIRVVQVARSLRQGVNAGWARSRMSSSRRKVLGAPAETRESRFKGARASGRRFPSGSRSSKRRRSKVRFSTADEICEEKKGMVRR